MNLNHFVESYELFLVECRDKGWTVEIIEPALENYIASITNQEGKEVRFMVIVDFENSELLYGSINQSMLNSRILKPEGDDDSFAKEVRIALENFMERHAPKLN